MFSGKTNQLFLVHSIVRIFIGSEHADAELCEQDRGLFVLVGTCGTFLHIH